MYVWPGFAHSVRGTMRVPSFKWPVFSALLCNAAAGRECQAYDVIISDKFFDTIQVCTLNPVVALVSGVSLRTEQTQAEGLSPYHSAGGARGKVQSSIV